MAFFPHPHLLPHHPHLEIHRTRRAQTHISACVRSLVPGAGAVPGSTGGGGGGGGGSVGV